MAGRERRDKLQKKQKTIVTGKRPDEAATGDAAEKKPSSAAEGERCKTGETRAVGAAGIGENCFESTERGPAEDW